MSMQGEVEDMEVAGKIQEVKKMVEVALERWRRKYRRFRTWKTSKIT